ILLDQRVLRFGQDLDERAFVQFVKHAADRQASHKLRNQAKPDQIFGLNGSQRLCMAVGSGFDFGLEAERLVTQPSLDHFFETNESSTADEQNIRRVDREKLLMRMLAST